MQYSIIGLDRLSVTILTSARRGDLGSRFSNAAFLNTKEECYWFNHNVQHLRFADTSKRTRFFIISTNLPQEYRVSTLKSATVTSFYFIQQSIITEDFCVVIDTPASCLRCPGFKLLHNEQPSWMRMYVILSVLSAVQAGTGSIFLSFPKHCSCHTNLTALKTCFCWEFTFHVSHARKITNTPCIHQDSVLL